MGSPQPRLFAAMAGLLFFCGGTSAEAARQRWTGTAASNRGGFVRAIVRVKFVTATTAAGSYVCRKGSNRCLARRGSITLQLGGGQFEAVIALNNGGRCYAEGVGTSSSLVGDYGCYSGATLVDSGVFSLNRKR